MRYISLILAFALVLSSCRKDDGEVVSPNTQQEFDSYLANEADAQNIKALSVLLFKGSEVKYEKYLGTPDEVSSAVLNDSHIFLLASVSKTVTATAIMQLYDQGKCNLDDKINDHLPFTVKVPNSNTDITIRMLLTHTSAIADGDALDGQYFDNQDSPTPLVDFMKDYLTPTGKYYNASQNFYDHEPGTRHEYSNTGSALIAVLVEQLSGMSFNEYCKQNIFKPLEMNNTYWRLDETPTSQRVRPYDDNKRLEHYTFTDYPNGGLRSTVKDMFKFLSTYANDGMYGSYQLLKASTVKEMLRVQNAGIDAEAGLHWFIMNSNNNIWGHDGGEKGVATIMGYNPDNKTGALIFTNQGNAELDNMLLSAYNYAVKL